MHGAPSPLGPRVIAIKSCLPTRFALPQLSLARGKVPIAEGYLCADRRWSPFQRLWSLQFSNYVMWAWHLTLLNMLSSFHNLQGAPFDTEARRPFIERLLSSRASRPQRAGTPAAMGPLKSAVARTALMYLMQSNLDLLDSSIDQCYSPDLVVARAHFKARCTALGHGTCCCAFSVLANKGAT